MLEGVVEPRPEVKDIAELVAEMLVEISDDQVDVWTPESETVGV